MQHDMNNRLLLLLDPISARMPKLSGNEVMDHVPCPLKSQVATFLPRSLGKQRFFQGIGNLISLRPRRFGKTRIEIRDQSQVGGWGTGIYSPGVAAGYGEESRNASF